MSSSEPGERTRPAGHREPERADEGPERADEGHGPFEEGLEDPARVRAVAVAAVRPMPGAATPLAEAAGLVLVEPLVAGLDLPPFSNAAMDGYAVRAADTAGAPVSLRVVGRSLAGRVPARPLQPGEASVVTTGAMLPEGADAVVPVEETETAGDVVRVRGAAEPGRHVRHAGEDVRRGQIVLATGSILGPGQLAAASALGITEVVVFRRPRVAVVPTGDEVRSPEEALEGGTVHDAVSVPLAALLREVGAVPVPRPIAPDRPEGLEAAVREAAGVADAVLTVGGVSMGERDLVRRLGIASYRVALRPAKPFAVGRLFGAPLFGLPGNPAAALAAFEELVRPAVLAMLGRPPSLRPSSPATLVEPIRQRPGRLHLVRVEVWRDGERLMARPAGLQGAAMVHSLARAGGWAVVPPTCAGLPAGAEVRVRLLVEPP